MLRYTPSIVILFLGLLFHVCSHAQGWQWGRGNTGSNTDGWPVATDKYGNVFCACMRSGNISTTFGTYTVPFSGGAAGFQCIVAKYDPNGNFQWAVGNDYGVANLISIATDPGGNVFLYGSFDSGAFKIGSYRLTNTYRKNNYKYFLAKIDPLGNVLWACADGSAQANFATVGGIFTLLGLGDIAADNAGNVYITANFSKPSITIGGNTLNNTDPSGLSEDFFVAKYDPSGNVVWARSYGGKKSDDAYAITVTPSGDIYVAGDFASPAFPLGAAVITDACAAQVAFIARLDAAGNPVWASASGGTGYEYAAALASDAAGNVYLTGGFKDNSIGFGGATITNPDVNQVSLYLVKFNPSNSVSWYKTIGSPDGGNAWGYSVAVSSCGYVWVSGAMQGYAGALPCQVSVDGNTFTSPRYSYDPVFLACYTLGGAYVDCQVLPSGGDDEDGLACDPSGNVYICSDYEANSPFSIGNTMFPSDTLPYEFLYLAKYAPPYLNTNNFRHSDTALCFSPGILLSAPGGYADYTWNDGKKGASHGVSDTGIIWVRGDDTCGIYALDTFRLSSFCDCGRFLFVPNSFTPNGDGQNDVFYPRSSNNNTQIKTFRIYNRWGELLFERENIMANDAANAWDGTCKGNLALPDVYVYIVEAVCEKGTVINKKGSVTVIR